jgi:hypothetical protein
MPRNPNVVDYDVVTISSTANDIVTLGGLSARPKPAQSFIGILETAAVRMRGDGTDPTATEGVLVNLGEPVLLSSSEIDLMKFIRVGGTPGVLRGHYYDVESSDLLAYLQGSSIMQGPAASDTVEKGNPVQIGLSVDLTSPAVAADGDVRRVRGTERGNMIVAIGEDGASNIVDITTPSDGKGADYSLFVLSHNFALAPDGLHDRLRTVGDTAGTGLGALMVSPTGHAHNSVTGDEQILSAAGKLHTISIHDITTGGTITVYDNTAESGTVIATLVLAAGEGFMSLHYDVACGTGLYIGYDTNVVGALTVSYSV